MKRQAFDIDFIAAEVILLAGTVLFLSSGRGVYLSPGEGFSFYFWVILGSLSLSIVFVFLLIVMKSIRSRKVSQDEISSKKYIKKRG